MIISPGDVPEERDAVEQAIARWNEHEGRQRRVHVQAVRWEVSSTPKVGAHPQHTLNTQLVFDADLGVAVFHSRLGTPTPEFASGSVEEVERLTAAGRDVLVYFSAKPHPNSVDPSELTRLHAFRSEMQARSLYDSFDSSADLRAKIASHLSSTLPRDDSYVVSASEREPVATAPRPDIRMSAGIMTKFPVFPGEEKHIIRVSAGNHSPWRFYPGHVYVRLASGLRWVVFKDAATGAAARDSVVEPGDAFQFFMSPAGLVSSLGEQENLLKAVDGATLEIEDRIGRVFTLTGPDNAEFFKALVAHASGASRSH